MLTVQLGGKTVTTTNNKQVIKINGNEVEIERIGDGIYVNARPINLIIADKTGLNWKNIFGGGVIGGGIVIGVYFLLNNAPGALEFITTQGSALIDLVMSFVN